MMHCLYVKMGIFSDQDGFKTDRVLKQIKFDMDESEALTIIENCADKNEQGSPVDVWVYRGYRCLFDSKLGDQIKFHINEIRKKYGKSSQKSWIYYFVNSLKFT